MARICAARASMLLACALCLLAGSSRTIGKGVFLYQEKIRNKRAPGLRTARSLPRQHVRILSIRGGAAEAVAEEQEQTGPLSVLVSTSYGSSFLDKKKRLQVPRNTTVAELKAMIEQKFPANPPCELQRLFFGVRYLRDEDRLGNLTSASVAPILLDMPSGTSVYNKSMSIAQALEAYSSLVVQQAYLANTLKSLYEYPRSTTSEEYASRGALPKGISTSTTESSDTSSIQPESIVFRDMFKSLNESLYATYAADISSALELEKEPETVTDDTAPWRGAPKQRSPLVAAFAKEFDINVRTLKMFIYFSGLLAFFAYFGTSNDASSQLLLGLVPLLWISKLRQLRLLGKLVSYIVLPVLPTLSFLMPLLPAPQQVIAIETAKLGAIDDGSPFAVDMTQIADRVKAGVRFITKIIKGSSGSTVRVKKRSKRVVLERVAVEDEEDASEELPGEDYDDLSESVEEEADGEADEELSDFYGDDEEEE